jgi:hypothetical protein
LLKNHRGHRVHREQKNKISRFSEAPWEISEMPGRLVGIIFSFIDFVVLVVVFINHEDH